MAVVDFSGAIGGVSLYGKGLYGTGLYSRGGPFAPGFSASLTFWDQFVGDLAPQVTFAASLSVLTIDYFTGDLAPTVTFAADLSLDVIFVALAGGIVPVVGFAGSSMISGPLWPDATPCPPLGWNSSDPCPPPLWTPSDPCEPADWEESALCNG